MPEKIRWGILGTGNIAHKFAGGLTVVEDAELVAVGSRTQEAADVYREWAVQEPQSAKARHMVAAVSQNDVPVRAADDYVRELFDGAARSFDANLGKLNYQAPKN